VRAVSHSRVVLLSLSVAFVATSLSGCKNRKEEARQRAELTKALDQFKTQVGELQKQAAGLRARLNALPEDLPGIETVRGNVLAVEEVLGVEDARTRWLAGELDKAFASGKKEEIERVRNEIPAGTEGIAKVVMNVTHELVPFERAASQRRFFEELDAENARKAAEQQAQKQGKPRAK
jgi:hypothetical protein